MNNFPYQGRTVIGTFSDKWDADSAYEDLKFAGFAERIRYIHQPDLDVKDDTKSYGGFSAYFARVHGFENEDEYHDSKDNFSVNPEAEDYFLETFENKLHVILLQVAEEIDKAIDILKLHHGKVETKHWVFFTAVSKDDYKIAGEAFEQPPKIHPTSAIEPPRDSIVE